MQILVGILIAVIIYLEIDRRQMRERMLLQANVPQTLGPVRTSAPLSDPGAERIDTRRKIATLKIPV